MLLAVSFFTAQLCLLYIIIALFCEVCAFCGHCVASSRTLAFSPGLLFTANIHYGKSTVSVSAFAVLQRLCLCILCTFCISLQYTALWLE